MSKYDRINTRLSHGLMMLMNLAVFGIQEVSEAELLVIRIHNHATDEMLNKAMSVIHYIHMLSAIYLCGH